MVRMESLILAQTPQLEYYVMIYLENNPWESLRMFVLLFGSKLVITTTEYCSIGQMDPLLRLSQGDLTAKLGQCRCSGRVPNYLDPDLCRKICSSCASSLHPVSNPETITNKRCRSTRTQPQFKGVESRPLNVSSKWTPIGQPLSPTNRGLSRSTTLGQRQWHW